MDENQSEIFNELHRVAEEIVGKIQSDLGAAHSDINGALDELRSVNKQLDELRNINKNLSAELAKSQEARRNLEDNQNFLRDQNYTLTANNRKLAEALQETQTELSKARREVTDLRNRLTQVQRFLAG